MIRHGYSLRSYGNMIKDAGRMQPYKAALERVVRPGSIVLDIGAGTGIVSLLACQLGAAHVYAVEPDTAIQVGREMIAANGYADKVTVYQALSSEISLPRPADVIVSDLRGVLPLFRHHIPAIADARERHLAAGGALIPQEDRLFAVPIELHDRASSLSAPWLHNAYDLDLSAPLKYVANSWWKLRGSAEGFLSDPVAWASLDYATRTDPNVSGQMSWSVHRSGTIDGLLLWFDSRLLDEIGFSNAPDKPELIYGNAFFPLLRPVAVECGDIVQVSLSARLVNGEYVWKWDTTIRAADGSSPKGRFRQSTFFGNLFSPDELRRTSATHVPSLSEAGKIDRFVLQHMDQSASLGEIAKKLLDQFPSAFPDKAAALTRVADLSHKYSS